MTRKLTVLVVNPWAAGSHLAWAEGWQRSSRHDVHLLSHEGRAWRWRMRGAALTLGSEAAEWIRTNGEPDLVVATDMLDLGSFLAVIRRVAPGVASALYMHENQLNYPRQPGEPLDQGLAWTNWRSIVVADSVWFNSGFHRDELLSALPRFLGSVGDHDHLHIAESVAVKSRVVPVGIAAREIAALPDRRVDHRAGPLVLSNHRWHHDKDVEAILRALLRLADRGLAFRVAVIGDEHGGCGVELAPLIERLGDRVSRVGHLPRGEYLDLLSRSDIVVSAARNEFFGIAVAEAIVAGAVPVLPRRLAYPEIVPAEFHDAVLYPAGGLTAAIEDAVVGLDRLRERTAGLASHLVKFGWDSVGPIHDAAALDTVAHVEKEHLPTL